MNLNTVKYKNKTCQTNQKNDIPELDKAKHAQASNFLYKRQLNAKIVADFIFHTESVNFAVFIKDKSTLKQTIKLNQRSSAFCSARFSRELYETTTRNHKKEKIESHLLNKIHEDFSRSTT